jgi:hypothetical protein
MSEIGDVCRRIAVRRFSPTLGAANHAASDDGQAWLRIEPVAAGFIEGQFKTVGADLAGHGSRPGRQLHDPRRQRTLFEHLASRGKFVSP